MDAATVDVLRASSLRSQRPATPRQRLARPTARRRALGRPRRAGEHADRALRFAAARGDPEANPLTSEEVREAGYEVHSGAVYDALSARCQMGSQS